MNKDFSGWISARLTERDWSQNRLAKEAHVSSSAMSRVMNGQRPTLEICRSIARALNLPAETVLREAGLLPIPRMYSPADEEMISLFGQLSEDDQEELLQWARLKIERKKKGVRSGKAKAG